MAEITEIRVPDIGDFENVDVVEVFVEPGAHVDAEQSLITIESEKASLEIPAPAAGTIREVKVAVGDKVSEGSIILTLELDGGGGEGKKAKAAPKESEEAGAEESEAEGAEAAGADDQAKEEPTQRAKSRKPPPSPLLSKEGEPESKEGGADSEEGEPEGEEGEPESEEAVPEGDAAPKRRPAPEMPAALKSAGPIHASPSVRRFARELGADLGKVDASGPKGRILKEDVQAFVKRRLAEPAQGGFALPPLPKVDFAKYGEVRTEPLSKINRLTARNVHRSWLHIPHVTQFDEADITDLEQFRKSNQPEDNKFKLTFLSFLLKACAGTLKVFPRFNSSLDENGENLIFKSYYNIGVAVDTEQGLVVPVIHDVDSKGIFELAEELAAVSGRARAGKLSPKDIQGGTFSISSLGGIGGTAFTPIINAPEVAILGIARASTKPVYRDDKLVPRLILPLCLSYDHRVIDGAAAARFTTHLASLLGDIRRLAL